LTGATSDLPANRGTGVHNVSIMSVPLLERFFRAASRLDVDRDDVERYSGGSR
jgi:hypothetical protein